MSQSRPCGRAAVIKNSREVNDLELVVLLGVVDGVALELEVGRRHDGGAAQDQAKSAAVGQHPARGTH